MLKHLRYKLFVMLLLFDTVLKPNFKLTYGLSREKNCVEYFLRMFRKLDQTIDKTKKIAFSLKFPTIQHSENKKGEKKVQVERNNKFSTKLSIHQSRRQISGILGTPIIVESLEIEMTYKKSTEFILMYYSTINLYSQQKI